MKKLVFSVIVMLCCASVATQAQSTSSSTDKSKTTKASGQGVKTPEPKSEKKSTDQPQGNQAQSANSDKPNPTDQVAQQSSENDGSNRPGGQSHENANDVGRYSDEENSKSMLYSKEAIETRRKNMTESDTVLKDGSGAAPRNTRNHTGTTGNYRNTATKASKVPSHQ